MRSQLHMIVDLQFGSTGKGLFAGYLAEKIKPDTIIIAWGPNSGHTYVNELGEKFVNIMLPNGIISRPKQILLGPGSVINPEILEDEIRQYSQWFGVTDFPEICIHPLAAVVMERHRQKERDYGFKIGSTMKGVGEAIIQKIQRNPNYMNVAATELMGTYLEQFLVNANEYDDRMDAGKVAIVEGCQGYSLSINQGFYPYTTSRDCTVQQLLVDCAIPIGMGDTNDIEIHGVARTYPIRVANRFNDKGEQVGTSGPCYDDQKEIEWSEIGREPELTTVTKLPRRIFTFSAQQVNKAIRMNGVDDVFLNFCNYMDPNQAASLYSVMDKIKAPVRWTGWGPRVTDVKEAY